MKTLVYCINIPCSAAANICILPGLLAGNHHLAECAVACVEDGLYMMQHMDMEMCSVRIHIWLCVHMQMHCMYVSVCLWTWYKRTQTALERAKSTLQCYREDVYFPNLRPSSKASSAETRSWRPISNSTWPDGQRQRRATFGDQTSRARIGYAQWNNYVNVSGNGVYRYTEKMNKRCYLIGIYMEILW